MKLIDLWKTSQKPTLSFELFPARSPKAAERLDTIYRERKKDYRQSRGFGDVPEN